MALTPSGAISLNDINTSTGKSSGTPISMSGTAVRCISDTNSGAVSMSALRGKNVAGGTITSGTKTTSGKSGTTVANGFNTNTPAPTYGTIGVGTMSTLWTGFNSIESLQTTRVGTGNYNNACNIRASSSAGMSGSTLRTRIGSTDNFGLAFGTYIGSPGTGFFGTLSATFQMISSADVGVTRDWVMTKV